MPGVRYRTESVSCDDDPWLTWIYNSLEVMERKKKKSFSEWAYVDLVYLLSLSPVRGLPHPTFFLFLVL